MTEKPEYTVLSWPELSELDSEPYVYEYPKDGEEFELWVAFFDPPSEDDEDGYNKIIECPKAVANVLGENCCGERLCHFVFGDDNYPTTRGLWLVKIKTFLEKEGSYEEGYYDQVAFYIVSSEKIE